MRILLGLWSFSLLSLFAGDESESPLNVLLICVDDLRPELACYGKSYIQSPNIDALAARGMLFKEHYVQAPTCGASRYAMLTGRYGPSGNQALFERGRRQARGEEVRPSLPGWFREQGYRTVSVGKVSHHPGGLGGGDWNDEEAVEMPGAWDRSLLPVGPWLHPRGWMHGLADGEIRKKDEEMAVYQAKEGPDASYPDGVMVPAAVAELQQLALQKEPFFLAVGILRPHLPFGAPKKYLDLYQGVELPVIPHREKPSGRSTWHRSGEFRRYENWGKDPNEDEEFATEVRRHYAACVSYADAMVGQILQALKESGEGENTVVVLWGDHGWHLGEHAVWGKHTLFEESLRAPLIVAAPGLPSGGKSSALVQSVDLFPTLCELTGLTVPPSLDGETLLPILKDPQAGQARKNARTAFAYHGDKQTLFDGDFRLIQHPDGYAELYKAGQEERNLATEEPKVLAAMQARLAALLAQKSK